VCDEDARLLDPELLDHILFQRARDGDEPDAIAQLAKDRGAHSSLEVMVHFVHHAGAKRVQQCGDADIAREDVTAAESAVFHRNPDPQFHIAGRARLEPARDPVPLEVS